MIVLPVALLAATYGLGLVSIPVHTTASITAAGASTVVIAPAPSAPYAAGQRVFVRRKSDGVVVARGSVVRVLASSAAEARVDAKLASRSLPAMAAIVETGREPLLHALLPIHQPSN